MDDNALRDLLSAHADALNAGEERVDHFLQKYPSLPPESAALLNLARQVKQLLAPVPVSESFRGQLRQHLRPATDAEVSLRLPDRRRPLWLGAAALGSLLSLMGLFLLWWRRQRTHTLAGAT